MTVHDQYPLETAPAASQDLEDAACLSRVALGDRAAFEHIYRNYYERVFRFVLRVTGRMSLVEDVVNDTMLVIWNKAADFRAVSKVSTWIFGVAYRKSLKAMARENRRADPLADATEPLAQAAELLDRERLRAAIRDALMRLPAEHRAVVELTFYFNCSYGDIAQVLDCPVGTVKSRMFHAREKLRPLLSHLLGDLPS
jgi:RNA polymerase sigma-70 factor (ECF subfamily)